MGISNSHPVHFMGWIWGLTRWCRWKHMEISSQIWEVLIGHSSNCLSFFDFLVSVVSKLLNLSLEWIIQQVRGETATAGNPNQMGGEGSPMIRGLALPPSPFQVRPCIFYLFIKTRFNTQQTNLQQALLVISGIQLILFPRGRPFI